MNARSRQADETCPVRLLFAFEDRIAEATANGDLTAIREIASDIQHERLDHMARFTRSRSVRNRAHHKAEYFRLKALVEPLLPLLGGAK